MAFLDATTKSLRVHAYNSEGSLIDSKDKVDVPYLWTTLEHDPYGRAGEPSSSTILLSAPATKKICVEITSIHQYDKPSSANYTAWGTYDTNRIGAYNYYVEQGTWNVGLVMFAIKDSTGSLLPEGDVIGTQENDAWSSETECRMYDNYGCGAFNNGYHPFNALKNAYHGLEKYVNTTTSTSWSWGGHGTVTTGSNANFLYTPCP